MPKNPKYLFVSYARPDAEAVRLVVDALKGELARRSIAVSVWMDTDDLQPGQQWQAEIERVLRESVGLLCFISRSSVASSWVRSEIYAAAQTKDRLILPVMLEKVDLPETLSKFQWVDLSGRRTRAKLQAAVKRIADATAESLGDKKTRAPVPAAKAPALAARIAEEVRSAGPQGEDETAPPDTVFVVYGHAEKTLEEVETYLNKIGVKTIVLSRIPGAEQSLLQKFFKLSADARFAIVIMSADDYGVSRLQYEAEGVGDKALQFRARQNVILELGFFYGRLGWENVFVVNSPPDKPFPNFETPSDLGGVVFDAIDEKGKWRKSLRDRLLAARFKLRQAD
jgi:predicted nucleotide-binding protein